MFWLAKVGFLPKSFLKLQHNHPPCISCLFGQAHRKPWWYKSSVDGKESVLCGNFIDQPGQKVGVNQLISEQPGLAPQDKWNSTCALIWASTIFVDDFTKLVHVALMTNPTVESALKAKYEFEHLAGTRDIPIKHYHTDDGIFTYFLFCEDCMNGLQQLSLCVVGAHHQNGIVEWAIKTLTLISWMLLLHAQQHWPECIMTMLWPLALKAAQDRMNQLMVDLDGRTPEMKFSGITLATICLCDCHTWGCPCYILDSWLQTNPKGVPKWEPWARLVIYIGRSLHHAKNVALVLNPNLQFHVVFDNDFSTVPHLGKGTVSPKWAELVWHLSEKMISEFFNLTKTWFQL